MNTPLGPINLAYGAVPAPVNTPQATPVDNSVIQNNAINSTTINQQNGPVASPSTPAVSSKTPLKSAVASLGDVSGAYGLVNGTVYDKNTNTAFATPEQFFKASGLKSFNGLKFDTTYKPPTTTTAGANAVLNGAQQSAMTELTGTVNDDISDMKSKAQEMIDKATTAATADANSLVGATTGANDLRTQADAKYKELGIDKIQADVDTATKEYYDIKGQQADNLSQREDQLAGGGTESFAKGLDNKDQRTLAIQELAASVKLQVAQQRLNTAVNVFNTFTQVDNNEQAHQVSALSTKLGLDKQDLQTGVTLLNQALSEENQNQTAARNLLVNLAQNLPGFVESLSPADKQSLGSGQITPSILTAIGAATTKKDAAGSTQVVEINKQQVLIDTKTGATIRVLGNAASAYTGAASVDSSDAQTWGQALFSGTPLSKVPTKYKTAALQVYNELKTTAAKSYGSEFEARVDYNNDIKDLSNGVKQGKSPASSPSEIVNQLTNQYGAKISKQEIQGTVDAIFGSKK